MKSINKSRFIDAECPLPISKKRLTFRTWELLSIKMISKVVDELSVKALHVVDSKHPQQTQNPKPLVMEIEIETDTIKRLVQAFLPKFPDDCRLENNLKVIFLYYDWNHTTQERNRNRNRNRTIRLKMDPCPDSWVGDSLWIVYGYIRDDGNDDDLNDLDDSLNCHPSAAGIACVEILSKQQQVRRVDDQDDGGGMVIGGATIILANIREKLSFDRFCEYFQNTDSSNNNSNEMDVSYYNEHQPGKFPLSGAHINLWRRNDQVLGIDMKTPNLDYFATERMYKQVDGTWCHGFSMFADFSHGPHYWECATVGRSFLSNDRVQGVTKAWMDLTGAIENV